MKTSTTIYSALLAVALLSGGRWQVAYAQDRVQLESESLFWIEGSSTVNKFTCRSDDVSGFGVLEDEKVSDASLSPAGDAYRAKVELTVRVASFDCGKQRMNLDLYSALHESDHPLIRYELDEASVLSPTGEEENQFKIETTGRLRIAGLEKSLTVTVLGKRLDDGRYRVNGTQTLLMSDFGIDPPSALLGLIKAHDRIRVRFELVASPAKMYTQSPAMGAPIDATTAANER